MRFSLSSIFSVAGSGVLLVAADRATLYRFAAGDAVRVCDFSADQTGYAAFAACLAELSLAQISLLVDIVEEEYRAETIPHVSGPDRHAILERRYARLFRATPYRSALFHGRIESGRRDDRVLLTALTRPEILTEWLAVIAARKLPLVGIYSLPILSRRLLGPIRAQGGNVLLISAHRVSGLRQSFFLDGQLRISRLAQVPAPGAAMFVATVFEEIEKLQRYLLSLALITHAAPLRVYILGHGAELNEINKAGRVPDHTQVVPVDLVQVERALGIKDAGGSPHADRAFARLLHINPPRRSYARVHETYLHKASRVRRWLASGAAMLLCASGGWSMVKISDALAARERAFDAAQKTRHYRQGAADVRSRLPLTPVSPRVIQLAVDAVTAIELRRPRPDELLAVLGAALNDSPAIELERVHWEQSPLPGSGRPGPPPSSAAPSAPTQVVELSGRCRRCEADYHAAMEVVDAFSERLEQTRRVRTVEVLQYPLDMRSDMRVSGSTRVPLRATDFRLRVVLEHERG